VGAVCLPDPVSASSNTGGARAVLRRTFPKPVRRALWAANDSLTRAEQRVFERRLGVSTSGHVYIDDGTLTADRVFYQGCEWLPLRRMLRSLKPGPGDVFVDLGSGKGQALLVAAGFDYDRVLGIEMMPELVDLANDNLLRAASKLRCRDVRSERGDVLDWQMPDDVTTVFLYCPFNGEIFHQALGEVFASYDRKPRQLRIVYGYPWEHNWLVGTGRVVVEDVRPSGWPTKPWWWRTGWVNLVYRVVGPGEARSGPPQVRRRLFRPHRALKRWGGPNDQTYRLRRGADIVSSATSNL
jgi:SAM-dependent methyltransferase